jgi:[ribosomal protein S5]-alanine N-acetyltransferase
MQILETSRIVLREFMPRDVDGLSLVLSDPETMRYYPARFDRTAVEEWIERQIRRYAVNGHGLWGMISKSNHELVGDCGLTAQVVDGVVETEIGYHVRRDLWGKGLRRKLRGHAAITVSLGFPSND